MNVNKYAIVMDEPFGGVARLWPETVAYNFNQNGHMLLYAYRDWRPAELDAIRERRASFTCALWFETSPVLIFQSRFGVMPWSDSFFTYHLVPDDYRRLPEIYANPDERAICSIVGINADDGVVVALRVLTFSPSFTRQLHAAIVRQAQARFDEAEYNDNYAYIMKNYTTRELRRRAAASCVGGADDRPAAF